MCPLNAGEVKTHMYPELAWYLILSVIIIHCAAESVQASSYCTCHKKNIKYQKMSRLLTDENGLVMVMAKEKITKLLDLYMAHKRQLL